MSTKNKEPDLNLGDALPVSREGANLLNTRPEEMTAGVFSYRPSLKAIAATLLPKHLKSRVDDSDLVQETLLKAVAQADQIRANSPEQLEAWLRETLINSVRDCIRFHGRQQRSVSKEQFLPLETVRSTDPSASEQFRKEETNQIVLNAVMELPEDYRTVILLRQQMDLTFPEIAERMQRSADAVRMLWGRALVALSGRLDAANKDDLNRRSES